MEPNETPSTASPLPLNQNVHLPGDSDLTAGHYQQYPTDTSHSVNEYDVLMQAIRSYNWEWVRAEVDRLKALEHSKQEHLIEIFDTAVISHLPLHDILAETQDVGGVQITEALRFKTMTAMIEAAPNHELRYKMVNHYDRPTGLTPLHMAAGLRPVEFARYLIDRGAAVNEAAWKDGGTPLHCAAQALRHDTVELLLQNLKGADHTPYDNCLSTPVDMARHAQATPTATNDTNEAATATIELLQGTFARKLSSLEECNSSIVPKCHLYLVRTDTTDNGTTTRSFVTNKPVEEVLGASNPWLKELRRRQSGAGRPPSVDLGLSGWIHLREHKNLDVCASGRAFDSFVSPV